MKVGCGAGETRQAHNRMRTSVVGPIAAHMQSQAILSPHEETREALAQIGARGGVAARFREVAFPMASVKEHQSRTEALARRSILCDGNAPQGVVPRPYCLGSTVDSDQSEHPLQIGVDVGRRCRALNVFCLRDLGFNARRYLGWIFSTPR